MNKKFFEYLSELNESEEDLDIYDDIENEIDFENEYEDTLMEEAFMEGYMDALNEMTTITTNPLPIIGGGDIKGDILSAMGIGDGPDRAAAIKKYLDNGNVFKGGLIGGIYGTKGGMLYRNNRYLPGSDNKDINSDADNFMALYARLKPADRKKLMNDFKKSLKKLSN